MTYKKRNRSAASIEAERERKKHRRWERSPEYRLREQQRKTLSYQRVQVETSTERAEDLYL